MLIDFRKEVPINYTQMAQTVHRSRSTVRKWRAKIEELSGHSFTRVRISRSLYDFDFNEKEVTQFIQLAQYLDNGDSLQTAITRSFGNQKMEAIKQRSNHIIKLESEVKNLKENQTLLRSQIHQLSQEIEQLNTKNRKKVNKLWH